MDTKKTKQSNANIHVIKYLEDKNLTAMDFCKLVGIGRNTFYKVLKNRPIRYRLAWKISNKTENGIKYDDIVKLSDPLEIV